MAWQKSSSALLLAATLVLIAGELQPLNGQDVSTAPPATDAQQPDSPSSSDATEAAKAKLQEGQVAQAVCELDRAVAAYNESLHLHETAKGYALRGRAYAEHGDDKQAWADFERALALDRTQVDAFAGRGWLHAMRGEYEEAMADSTKAVQIDPTNVDSYINRAFVYRRTDRAALADSDIRTAERIDPSARQFRLPKGIQWFDDRDDAKEIVQACDEALQTNPSNLPAHLNRGFAYDMLGQRDKAIEDYSAVLQLNPTFSQGYNYRGLSKLRSNQAGKAIADFTLSIQFDPTFKWAYVNRAATWVALRHADFALEDLGKALEIDPKFKHALVNRIGLLINDNRIDEAIVDAHTLLDIQPEERRYSLPGFASRAQCWFVRREFDAAINDVDQLISRVPDQAYLYALRAWFNYSAGKLEEAVNDDAKAREIDARYGRDYRAMAATAQQAKQREALQPQELPAVGEAEKAVTEAIEEYRAHPTKGEWPARVVIDDRLKGGAGRLPVTYLEGLLRKSPDDKETGMAVAVCLGLGWPSDKPLSVARLLVELLDSPHERVRYRAAETIESRAREAKLTDTMAKVLEPSVKLAFENEEQPVIREALSHAQQALDGFSTREKQPK